MTVVRDARTDDDAGPALLYLSSSAYYDAFTGSEQRSLRLLEALWTGHGHTASHDSCRVAVRDGAVAGAIVAFPADGGDALARRFLAGALLRLGPVHWARMLRHLRASAAVMPAPAAGTLYVDALATATEHRRAGVATALLADAEARAARRGLRGVSLDTGIENAAARALYEGYGFRTRAERRVRSERIAAAVGGSGFVSYVKPL